MKRENEDVMCISSRGREPGLNPKDPRSAEQRIRERRKEDQLREMKAAAVGKRR